MFRHVRLPSRLLSSQYSGVVRLSHIASLALGLGLIYLALQLYRRKYRAYLIAQLVLTLLLALNLIYGNGLWRCGLYAFAIIVLMVGRRTFTVQSDSVSLRRAMGTAGIVIAGALLYGTIGFLVLEERVFGIDFTLWQSVKYAAWQILSFQAAVLPAYTEAGKLFLQSLDAVSYVTLALVSAALFKPVRFALSHDEENRHQARRILENSVGSTEEFFKLWPVDKHYYFDAEHRAFVAYKVQGRTALILDGPAGDEATYESLLRGFLSFADRNGWQPAIIHGDESIKKVSSQVGLEAVFIGNEAMVDVETFATHTVRSKHFRYIHNKAQRDGLSVSIWKAPLDNVKIDTLQQLSDEWLSRDGRREYTFIMGYFDYEYIEQCDVAVLYDAHSRALAYCNLIPTFKTSARSIDHMRFKPDVPGAGMHYLLKELILYLQTQHVTTFNLGLSPLAGISDRTSQSGSERALQLMKTIGARFYSFKGLEQFKNKFEPDWQPRYIYYQPPVGNLVRTLRNLLSAVDIPNALRRRRVGLRLIAVLAGLSFAAFPLAYLLGIRAAGLVSSLGAVGQPYSWLFNSLDIINGVLMTLLGVALLRQPHRLSRLSRWVVGLYIISGLANMLSALAVLPNRIGSEKILDLVQDNTTIYHAIFTLVGIAALYSAAALYSWQRRQKPWVHIAFWTLVITGVLVLVLDESATYRGITQRIQIVASALWIIIIGLLTARHSEHEH